MSAADSRPNHAAAPRRYYRLAALLLAVEVGLALGFTLASPAPAVTAIAPHTETNQSAYFYNQPSGQYLILFTVSHYEGDPFPYTLGANAYSNAAIVHTTVGLEDLAAFYQGGAGPVYEVKACLYPQAVYSVRRRQVSSFLARFTGGSRREARQHLLGQKIAASGIDPLDCTGDTYVGYYPPSMWFYGGAKRRP